MPVPAAPHGSGVAFALPHVLARAPRAAAGVATADSWPAWMAIGLKGGSVWISGRARCTVKQPTKLWAPAVVVEKTAAGTLQYSWPAPGLPPTVPSSTLTELVSAEPFSNMSKLGSVALGSQ